MPDLNEFLRPTEFLDFDKKLVKKKAMEITEGCKSNKEKAISLFYFVRDEIKYNMYTYIPQHETNLKASTTLRRKKWVLHVEGGFTVNFGSSSECPCFHSHGRYYKS